MTATVSLAASRASCSPASAASRPASTWDGFASRYCRWVSGVCPAGAWPPRHEPAWWVLRRAVKFSDGLRLSPDVSWMTKRPEDPADASSVISVAPTIASKSTLKLIVKCVL